MAKSQSLKTLIILVLLSIFCTKSYSVTSGKRKTYTVKELIKSARSKNYAIRINAEKVYRARQKIRVAMGRLLPSLNFGTIMAGVQQDYFDLVPSLLGFLFPSNWFQWKESKLYFEAERFNYGAMIANEINAIESVSYRILSVVNLEKIYIKYLKKVKKIVRLERKRRDAGEASAEVTVEFENIQLRMEHDLYVLQNDISKMLSELAHTVAVDIDEDWDSFQIAAVKLPDLGSTTPVDSIDLIDEIMDKSLEREALAYLRLAAKYSKYNRSFQFLSPDGDADGSFGFGYLANINIGKSYEYEVAIKQDELDSNILVAVRKAVSDHNFSIDLYSKSKLGYQNSLVWYDILNAKYNEVGEMEPSEYLKALESLLAFHSRLLQSQYNYLISKAQIDRLTWNRSYYRDILNIVPTVKNTSRNNRTGSCISRWIKSLKRKEENQKIKRHIKKGRIQLGTLKNNSI